MDGIRFDNLALRVLPIDPIEENYTRSVPGACFSRVRDEKRDMFSDKTSFRFKVKPTPVKNPRVVAYSGEALKLIDVSEEAMKVNRNFNERLFHFLENSQDEKALAQVFGGNVLLPGMEPAAHCKSVIGRKSISKRDLG